jgi:hypothetical protein
MARVGGGAGRTGAEVRGSGLLPSWFPCRHMRCKRHGQAELGARESMGAVHGSAARAYRRRVGHVASGAGVGKELLVETVASVEGAGSGAWSVLVAGDDALLGAAPRWRDLCQWQAVLFNGI